MKEIEEKFWYDRVLDALDRWRLVSGLVLLGFVIVGGFVLLFMDARKKSVVSETREVVEETIVPIESTQVANTEPKQGDKIEAKTPAPVAPKTETKTTTAPATSLTPTQAPATAPKQTSGLVNINTGTLAELESLAGIGPVIAQRVIDYRNTNGPFKTKEAIKDVKGIGDKTFDKFKDQITI